MLDFILKKCTVLWNLLKVHSALNIFKYVTKQEVKQSQFLKKKCTNLLRIPCKLNFYLLFKDYDFTYFDVFRFGKFLESIRKRRQVKFATSRELLKKHATKASYTDVKFTNQNLCLTMHKDDMIILNRFPHCGARYEESSYKKIII